MALTSFIPKPLLIKLKDAAKPILRKRWKKHPQVQDWVNKGWLTDKEIDDIVLDWQRLGAPIAVPHKLKQTAIQELAKQYGCTVLVETGTYRGDMMEAQKKHFEQLYSIELSKDFHAKAKQRFQNDTHINLLQGDSGSVLPKLAPKIDGIALFWLDGHYCGGKTALSAIECPIYAEMESVFKTGKKHVMLIDDARLFVGEHDYPTIPELTAFVAKTNPDYQVEVKDDLIRVFPKN